MSVTAGRGMKISLDDLRRTMAQIGNNMKSFVESLDGKSGENHLPTLAATVGKMGSALLSQPPADSGHTKEWLAFAAGNKKSLTTSAVRYLCWEPQIATNDRFLAYLWNTKVKLTARPLAGLVRSCHMRWDADTGARMSAGVIRDLVKQYEGSSQVILKWKSDPTGIFGTSGPEKLGKSFVAGDRKLNAFLQEWHLDPAAPFARELVEKATAFCREQFAKPPLAVVKVLFGELLPWGGWNMASLRKEVGGLILCTAGGMTRDVLTKFVMIHRCLGDPRLPKNEANWADMSEEARTRFEGWMAENPFALMERVYRQGKGWVWQKAGEAQQYPAAKAGQ